MERVDMTEQWNPVPGYEGFYEVSDLGEVRSLTRHVPYGKHGHTMYKGRVLKQFSSKNGYACVKLSICGALCTTYVHELVLRSFVGPRPATQSRGEIRHLDGQKANNSLVNLVYGTVVENGADRAKHNKARITK
jgi:hypothetical protein